ncbi:MAG: UDP-3-O-(3-hydroxymyristoyl)glucosamine N-acyltransferase [Bdellovibrionota bacterium]
MEISLKNIVEQTGCEVLPVYRELSFYGVAPLNMAQTSHVSFLVNEKYLDDALVSKAGAILCSKKTADLLLHKVTGLVLVCDDPYAAFAKISQTFFKPTHPFSGISTQAVIDQTAEIHPTATIFPFVFVGPGAHIGANTVIYSGCFIGAASSIGADCILYPNVVVREGCKIADRCLLNPGVVIGGEGFGFAPTEKENVKIPQIGGVIIAEDVEIGSNTTIDRGAMADTKIGRQTKIDNLVILAHGVEIGEFCFVAAQTGIAGSVVIGNRCVFAGQAGVTGHIKIGDNVTVTAQSGISKNIPAPGVWQGSPARPQKEFMQQTAALSRIAKKQLKGST